HTDKAVDATKTDTNGPELCALHNSLAQCNIARLEREHSSSSSCHAVVQLVLRVRRQTGIPHSKATRLEKFRNEHGVRLLGIHADFQCFDATHEQPRVKRRETATAGIDGKIEFLAQRLIVNRKDTSHEIVMPGKIFGSRFVHNVSSELQRILQERRKHSVVDADDTRW